MRRILPSLRIALATSMLLSPTLFPTVTMAKSPREDQTISPDERASRLVSQMTLDEKIQLLHGNYPNKMNPRPDGVPKSAGWVPGIERLGIPALRMTDASLGVAAAHQPSNSATALPSGLAMASTWDPKLAYEAGALIGKQTRQKGFNVLLAGGVNLVREPRNGRNFEYLGEDPLLAGTLVGHSIKGIQINNIISTIKHVALNAQETGRLVLNAQIDEGALRESDMLAFQKGIEIGDPGSVMCAYNRINGDYACENALSLGILKNDWGYKGWVMSDWGAVHSTVKAVNAGLDQEMGQELDPHVFFGQMLKDAVDSDAVKTRQIDAMVTRILRTLYAKGVMDNPVGPAKPVDLEAGHKVAYATAVNGIVLLKNDGNLLPLAGNAQRIAVIGSHADVGVLSGGGSSQVIPEGTYAFLAPAGSPSFTDGIFYHPSSPLDAIARQAPKAKITYESGSDINAAVVAARSADIVIVFGSQWTTEGMDAPMKLDGAQDALIDAVTAANKHTIVVLETGGPVLMPWLDKVGAVLEAWYPGAAGGPAIADILFGKVNPSGRLPVTFPASLSQLPNPALPGANLPRPDKTGNAQPEPFDVSYPEGADVGYRWYDRTKARPLFPFGYGLSYTSFQHANLSFDAQQLKANFRVTNTGTSEGRDTPQLYITPPGGTRRLVGWSLENLAPGETKALELTVDPRFLARYDVNAKAWIVDGGSYDIILAKNAADTGIQVKALLSPRQMPVDWRPSDDASSVRVK